MKMRDSLRPEPKIPDHEVLRKIGGGAYGEVWLARGVTGAMRAVKVVRREDFDDESDFEREFEGILKYEPISRDHSGLVRILHVGRSEQEGEFYYYVMELGDDIDTGNEINAVEYEPRNLRTDMKEAEGRPLDPKFVIEVGLSLSEALEHLHDKGLAHRDIKPANIIFVEGLARLADIGLVAARGQRTFVGTEGFVPPEGPGTAQADIYGLGKVLYEMATGKDRLQFPELPDELHENTNRKQWQYLNQVICDICEPRANKRMIRGASELAAAFRRLQGGKKVKRTRSRGRILIASIITQIIVGLVFWIFVSNLFNSSSSISINTPKEQSPTEVRYGFVKVISDPEGVEVYDIDGNLIDITPFKKVIMEADKPYWFEFKLDGYRTETREGLVVADQTTIVDHEMSVFVSPVIGQTWVDNMGLKYQPIEDYHVSKKYVKRYQLRKYEEYINEKIAPEDIDFIGVGEQRRVVLVTPQQAEAYCRWHTAIAIEAGYLNETQYISPVIDRDFTSPEMSPRAKERGLLPFRCQVKNIAFADLSIKTEPSGALFEINGEYGGITPREEVRLKPGPVELTVSLEGYRQVTQKLILKDHDKRSIVIELRKDNSVVFGEKWINSLEMKFVPVDSTLLVSVWETRVKDYAKYVKESKVKDLAAPGFKQSPDHPVVQVSREDAMAFCEWLTEYERKSGSISSDAVYRLLTDLEWSSLSGLEEDPDELPTEREFRPEQVFPWGTEWPPEVADFKVGNFADISALEANNVRKSRTLSGYDDGFVKTSPVGSFPPNELGICDLAGNAHEWVEDDYQGQGEYGVLRGGGWNSYQKEHLYVTQRYVVRPTKTSNFYGFRVALAKTSQPINTQFTDDVGGEGDE